MEKLTMQEIALTLGLQTESNSEVTSVCTDSREVVPGSLFVAIPGERVNGHDYINIALGSGAACVLAQEPGDYSGESRVLMVENTVEALLAISGYYRRRLSATVIGITGSVGKTTTKDMIAAVVEAKFTTVKTQGNQNNEIGMPRTLFAMDKTTQAAVVEMGMSGFGEIRELAEIAQPEIGVITNIGVSHMEHLGSRENILRAKLELAECLPDGAPLFLCKDNDLLAGVKIPRLDVIFYSLEDADCPLYGSITGADARGTDFTIHWRGREYPAWVPGNGRHLVQNALAAFGVGQMLDISPEDCIDALGGYTPSGMRQRVVEQGGITVVEDCYNASPDSMVAAIAAARDFPGVKRRILVLADMLELGDTTRELHRQVGELAAGHGIDILLAWGDLAAEYVAGAKAAGLSAATHFASKQELTETLIKTATPGDLVWVKGSRGMQLEEVIEKLYRAIDN